MSAPTLHLRAVDIAKVYGATQALKGVSLDVVPGKVTVLFGENGAGKSTLMNILAGIVRPTSGKLFINDEQVEFTSPIDAASRGIAIIHQELNLAPNMSVLDNIFMGREILTRFGTVDFPAQRRRASDVLQRLEEDMDLSTPVADLRIGQQQVVEIARALVADARLLIMDEPTSALSPAEVAVLFRVIQELTAADVAIVYISHHLEEALEISDHAVVFRDGRTVARAEVSDIDLNWVVAQMIGGTMDFEARRRSDPGDELLRLEGVSVANLSGQGRITVRELDLSLRAGEIVCLYGLMGSGRTELLEAVAGKQPVLCGEVRLQGRDLVPLSVAERIDAGLGLVPEDRQRDGIVQSMNVRENISLASLNKLLHKGVLSRRRERACVAGGINDVKLKTAGQDSEILSLSGGNQQKAVIAKLLAAGPCVLLLDEPTRGIDIGARGEIFTLLFEQARNGIGVLFATSEVGEALSASTRIIVMSKGSVVDEFDPARCTREQVMAAAGQTVSFSAGGAR